MGDTRLANGPQELPGPGVPKAVDGGRRRSVNSDAFSASAPGG